MPYVNDETIDLSGGTPFSPNDSDQLRSLDKGVESGVISPDDALDGRLWIGQSPHLRRHVVEKIKAPIKSDGGSSSYYTFLVPRVGPVETEEIITHMVDNDFDLGNILKCCRRISECRKGAGKEGNDELYDLRKIQYTINKLITQAKNE